LIWRTKLQLKPPSRFIGNQSSLFCLLSSVSCLLSSVFCPIRPSCPACLPSTLVETPLQIHLFFAKRTQFFQGQTQHNSLCRKGLPKQTTPGHSKKTNPIEPKRTQCQNRQNEDKLRNSKGLCKSTTNNEQRTLSKTNPIQTQFAPPLGRNTRYKPIRTPDG